MIRYVVSRLVVSVAMVLLADQQLGGPDAVGWLNAGLSVGALCAMVVVNKLAAHHKPAAALFIVMSVFAISVIAVGVLHWPPLIVAFVTIAGGATLIAEVIAVTLLQRAAPDELVARVFGHGQAVLGQSFGQAALGLEGFGEEAADLG